MSTTFSTTFTVTASNAHDELGEIAGILELIANGFNVRNNFAGVTITQTVRDSAGNIVGSWELS